ncbi:MAG TPA: hypothetical protein VFS26_04295 [Solirubrobacterales bacterium]|nr:hypothetical protein [Solirubrobacterales bacterium]
MAVAAPARKTAPAPPPSRTTPPKRKAPARKPARARAAAAPAKAPVRRAAAAAPARRPARRTAPTPRPKLVVVAGRTAVAVSQLPDSGLVVRMTRGRAWIAVLGVLLVGIVAVNVATLSFAASSGKIDAQITALEKENTMLESRVAERYSTARVHSEAAALGLTTSSSEEPKLVEPQPGDAAVAASRLAAAGG